MWSPPGVPGNYEISKCTPETRSRRTLFSGDPNLILNGNDKRLTYTLNLEEQYAF